MTPRKNDRTPSKAPDPPGALQREYGHSSGDRNTRTDEDDWTHFKDGKERTEHADTPKDTDAGSHRR